VARRPSFSSTFIAKVHRASAAIEKLADRELRVSFGLTFSQFMVLDALGRLKEGSQREVADYLGVTPAVITRQAEVLISRNLAGVNPINKRENSLFLTPKGEQALHEAAAMLGARQLDVFAHMSAREEVVLGRALDELIDKFAA
jgi:DNA-binding MarR family transcriptional regulator